MRQNESGFLEMSQAPVGEARQFKEQLRKIVPSQPIQRFENETQFRHPEQIEFLMDDLRKAVYHNSACNGE
jgi:hypothetical protein